MFELLGHFEEFLALEEVQVDGIFEEDDQVPSVYSILPVNKPKIIGIMFYSHF